MPNTSYYTHSFVSADASTTEASASFPADTIHFISNDDDTNNLLLNFDGYDTTEDSTLVLLPGEVLENLPRRVSSINYASSASTVAFRILGLRE